MSISNLIDACACDELGISRFALTYTDPIHINKRTVSSQVSPNFARPIVITYVFYVLPV